MRFGALLIPNAGWAALEAQARLAEECGFDTVWIDDHAFNPQKPEQPWLDAWATLGALARGTRTVRLGTLVSNVVLRGPVMLARHAATVNELSGGRLELGIGAGYASTDHLSGGTARWSPAERVDRLDEAAALIGSLLAGGPVTTCGGHYPVSGLQVVEPGRGPHRPRLTLAAHDRRSLAVAARHGDAWNSFGGYGLGAEQMLELTRERNRWLDEECRRLSRDPSTLGRSLLAGNPAVTAERLWSSVNAFEDFVGRYRDAGIDEFVFYFPPANMYRHGYDPEVFASVAAGVLPRLRAAHPAGEPV